MAGRSVTTRANRYYGNAYYNYSSEAYDIYNRKRTKRSKKNDLKNKKISRRSLYKVEKKSKNVVKKSEPKAEYTILKNESGIDTFKICFVITVVFVFSIILLCTYASNTQKLTKINTLSTELKQLEEFNEVLQTEIMKSLDFSKIEKIATTKLGMQKPAEHQIIYIDVPKQSYTVKYDDLSETVEQEGLSFSKMINYFFKE